MTAHPTNGNGASRLGIYASIFMAVATIFGAVFYMAGVASDVQANKFAIATESARNGKIEDNVKELQLRGSRSEASVCQQLAKVETQMGIVETIINENHVRDKADLGALKNKIFGEPAAQFYY